MTSWQRAGMQNKSGSAEEKTKRRRTTTSRYQEAILFQCAGESFLRSGLRKARGYSIFTSSPRDRADANIQWKNSKAITKYPAFSAKPHRKNSPETTPRLITLRIPSKE